MELASAPRPRAGGAGHEVAPRLLGETGPMQELRRMIAKVAALDCTVLIRGETGTGKELVARSIHQASKRSEARFLAINCGSFSQELLSNELFGHEKEAFTGADKVKEGMFEAAKGGTILLDEIGDTPQAMQTQLLRVLQEKSIIRVGGTHEVPVDVRVLAATNKTLRDEVASGKFREDLYYRLNAFILRIPPLRERQEDIPLLGRYFLDKYLREFDKKARGVSHGVWELLESYPFPGNVRELENIMERAVILCDGEEILPEHLPRRVREGRSGPEKEAPAPEEGDSLPTLAELEDEHIRRVMSHTDGNKMDAAKILGISRTSLWRKLKRMGEV
ncbi:sigma-54 interaction domain-containing protein [Desulfohalovibrio reitneri]|uniref:sigma-54 interaction domain-containing protein n=1 Tax=Desulfohalovibrio reitneri TaxID=1307759 RepID=UPI003CC58F9D